MKALITGGAGQDAHFLQAFLRDKGYEVLATECDVVDADSIAYTIISYHPTEVYNLAAVTMSANYAECMQVNAVGAINVLSVAREVGARFLQAGTVGMFGPSAFPCNEESAMRPQTAYGVSKVAAHLAVVNARHEGAYAVNAIMAHHESLRRRGDMVLQKIARAAATCSAIELSDLEVLVDWGDPRDYVRGMWMLLQAERPNDYLLCTNRLHSVREAARVAFASVGRNWRDYVSVNQELATARAGRNAVLGRPLRAQQLGWRAEVGFEELIGNLVAEACAEARRAA